MEQAGAEVQRQGEALTPLQHLNAFIDKFDPNVARVARQAVKTMRARFPSAEVLIYDNYNALAIGFGPTEKPSEAIFSIAVYPKYASLFFLQSGAVLDDPTKRLEGTGGRARHIKLKSADDLDAKDVIALMQEALARATTPYAASGKGKIVIKSVSAKQRPRRPRGGDRRIARLSVGHGVIPVVGPKQILRQIV